MEDCQMLAIETHNASLEQVMSTEKQHLRASPWSHFQTENHSCNCIAYHYVAPRAGLSWQSQAYKLDMDPAVWLAGSLTLLVVDLLMLNKDQISMG